MKYIKHYLIDDNTNTFCCSLEDFINPTRIPWKEYPGINPQVQLTDSDEVIVYLSTLPDSTEVFDILNKSGKKSVQVLSEEQYNSVLIPYLNSNSYDLLNTKLRINTQYDQSTLEQEKLNREQYRQTAILAIRNL